MKETIGFSSHHQAQLWTPQKVSPWLISSIESLPPGEAEYGSFWFTHIQLFNHCNVPEVQIHPHHEFVVVYLPVALAPHLHPLVLVSRGKDSPEFGCLICEPMKMNIIRERMNKKIVIFLWQQTILMVLMIMIILRWRRLPRKRVQCKRRLLVTLYWQISANSPNLRQLF